MQSSKFLLGSRVENFTLSFLRVLTSWFQVSLPFEKTMSQSSNAFLFSRPNVEYPSYQKFIFQTAGLRISRFMCTSVGKISLTPSFSTVAPLFAAESHQKSNRSPFFPSRQRSITELPLDSQLWSLLNYFNSSITSLGQHSLSCLLVILLTTTHLSFIINIKVDFTPHQQL